jgi:prepilin-type N-terminal cleavage/methylation domain-containing protein
VRPVGRLRREDGFTLVELLVATVIILVGLTAVASGFQLATSGVAVGRTQTVAAFLAEQRIEQLKAVAVSNYTGPWVAPLTLAAGTTVENCQTTDIGATSTNCQAAAITKTLSYTRTTVIVDNPVRADGTFGPGCTGVTPLVCKQIHVTVTYRPLTSRGDLSQTRRVDVYAVVAPRN